MRHRPLLTYFSLCYALTWGLCGLLIFTPALAERLFGPPGVGNPIFYLAVYVPSVVGILLTAYYDGWAGVKALFARLDPRRGGLWILVTMALFIVVGGVGAWISSLIGGSGPVWNLRAAPAILGLSALLDPGPVGEEFGWRGFALPRLFARWNPLVASVVLGLVWGIWHLPAFLIPELPQSHFNFPLFVLSTVALSVVMAWLALRSRGNLLVAITAHLMMNHVGDLTGVTLGPMQAAIGALAVLLVATGQMTRISGARVEGS